MTIMAGAKILVLFLAILVAPSTTMARVPSTPPCRGIKGGYWPTWVAETLPPSSIPSKLFTHLFYAFLVPDDATFQLSLTQTDRQWMGKFTAAAHAQTPPTKALMSIGGGGSNSKTFALIASNPANRAAFIKSTIEVARMYGFDGFDLDWEFPANPKDMSDFETLFRDWRDATNKESLASRKPRLLLSAAVYFSAKFFLSDVQRTYPGDAIRNYFDFVNPMCYDYHGAWDTSVTGAHALLYDKSSNISTSYGISSWLKNGVPPQKLAMGLPAYGRTWGLKDPNNHGIGAPGSGTGPGGSEGTMSYNEILKFNLAKKATVVFDSETVSTYSYAGTDWIGYDDARSITTKVKFAKANGLGGYFFWAIGHDDKDWTLAKAASVAWDSQH